MPAITGNFFHIGIYPEWNVKVLKLAEATQADLIGIYPEWNVKEDGAMLANQWIDWNISRMECKGWSCD